MINKISPQNNLTYNLGLLQEECAEVIQIVNKIRRFGLESEYNGKTNQESLFAEINDIYAVLGLIREDFSILHMIDDSHVALKKGKIAKFKEYSEQEGLLI